MKKKKNARKIIEITITIIQNIYSTTAHAVRLLMYKMQFVIIAIIIIFKRIQLEISFDILFSNVLLI